MAKTWYPTNLSGFYINEKFYYKLSLHYKNVSLRWENKIEQKLTPPPLRMVSDETVN